MAKFRNKYRIESARLYDWDYRNPGVYFITICIRNRKHHFGECKEGNMKLSAMGLMVQGAWFEIPRLNPHVRLGEFIVMPNHIHGVLILDEMMDKNESNDVETLNSNVSTTTPITNHKHEFFQEISPKSGSVSRILQQFKRACTYHIKCTFPMVDFEWQERFHDHIIRTAASFVGISNYIVNNPLKWEEDKFNDG